VEMNEKKMIKYSCLSKVSKKAQFYDINIFLQKGSLN